MTDRLKDKVAIVTGCGAVGPGWGNGKAISVLFAREGARSLRHRYQPRGGPRDAGHRRRRGRRLPHARCRHHPPGPGRRRRRRLPRRVRPHRHPRQQCRHRACRWARRGRRGHLGRGDAREPEERLSQLPACAAGDGAAGQGGDRQQRLDRRLGLVRRQLRALQCQQRSDDLDDTQHRRPVCAEEASAPTASARA